VFCAFQLKGADGKRVSLSQWRSDLNQQVWDLVTTSIVHPGIKSDGKHHRAYLVVNGDLDEEVSHAIDGMNRAFAQKGQPEFQLEVITIGKMLKWANELQTNLWPTEMSDIKTILEMYLWDGRDSLPKEKLYHLFDVTLGLTGKNEKPSKAECVRLISSNALLCALATQSFVQAGNHVAQIEAWTLYIASILAFASKWGLSEKDVKGEVGLALATIENALVDLAEELKERCQNEHFHEGDPMTDRPFYRARMTYLVGLCSLLGLWRRHDKIPVDDLDTFIKEFSTKHHQEFYLWGEAAIPQMLAFYWYADKGSLPVSSDSLLALLVASLFTANSDEERAPIPNPYLDLHEIYSRKLGLSDQELDEDSFRGDSYVAEALLHLCIRRGMKQFAQEAWPDFTRLSGSHFQPEQTWQYFKWRNREGTIQQIFPVHNQKWKDVEALAMKSDGETVPLELKTNPILGLLFYLVFPFRLNADAACWLDGAMRGF
jgi:hypothetical protein